MDISHRHVQLKYLPTYYNETNTTQYYMHSFGVRFV